MTVVFHCSVDASFDLEYYMLVIDCAMIVLDHEFVSRTEEVNTYPTFEVVFGLLIAAKVLLLALFYRCGAPLRFEPNL